MTFRDPEVLLGGITNAEGPVVLPDGRVVFTDTYRGLINVWSEDGREGIYAKVGGYPNGLTLGRDGLIYVANNGGSSGELRAFDVSLGYIQRVAEGGRPEIVATEIDGRALRRPNDLSFGPDGRLHFTDPGDWDTDNPDEGYVYTLYPDGHGETLVDAGRTYPNGVAVDAAGNVIWVESFTGAVKRLNLAGEIEEVHRFAPGHMPDGMAFAADGDLYVATLASGGIHVVHPDGRPAELIDLGGTSLTNCAFRGRELFLTDGGPASVNGLGQSYWGTGRLLRLQLGAEGMPIYGGQIPAKA
jgi:gluconolactonase